MCTYIPSLLDLPLTPLASISVHVFLQKWISVFQKTNETKQKAELGEKFQLKNSAYNFLTLEPWLR